MTITLLPALTEQARRFLYLHEQVEQAHGFILEKARDCGLILLEMTRQERLAVLSEARASERTGQAYMQVASNWTAIAASSAQRAAPLTIRGALALVKGKPRATPVITYSVKLDRVSPEDLVVALSGLRNRQATVTVTVRRARYVEDVHEQLRLFS